MKHTHLFYAKYGGLSIHIYEKYGKTKQHRAKFAGMRGHELRNKNKVRMEYVG